MRAFLLVRLALLTLSLTDILEYQRARGSSGEPIGVSPFPASSISLLLGRFRRRRFRRTRLFTLRYIRSSSILAGAKNLFFFVDLARVLLSRSFSLGLFRSDVLSD